MRSFAVSSRLLSGCALLWLATLALRADVHCPAIFGDHMVLQQRQPVPVWGEAAAGEDVTVEFAGQTVRTTAGADGRWQVMLAPLAASVEPRMFTVRGENTLTFSDVLVGEVWFCSGQSNMEKPFGPRHGQKPTEGSDAEITAADHPRLRLFQVPHSGRPKPGDASLAWQPSSPDALRTTAFSAIGYVFGRELQRELAVPVGVIHASFGGTRIEAWLPPDTIMRVPALRDVAQLRYPAWVPGVQPTELYESMVAPFVPFAVRGFVWYQGETNCMDGDCGPAYAAKFQALIASWRRAWRVPAAPFYFALLAPFDYSKWDKFPVTAEALPVMWESQAHALTEPHTGAVVTTDLVTDLHDIHPPQKIEVGRRFARLALAQTYGRTDLAARSPRFAALESPDGGHLVLRFTDSAGLRSRDGEPLRDFTVAGEDRRFHPAAARIEDDRVIVSSQDVAHPVAVRFAWSETATPNLVNAAGLPAMPFRTDDWPVVTGRPAKVVPATTP
jgi:sialate O-acetylesterase